VSSIENEHAQAMPQEDDVTNPFEDENGVYHVSCQRRRAAFPLAELHRGPAGWTIVHESDSRAACLNS
jgi:MbtH protein